MRDWVDELQRYWANWRDPEVPDRCQQFACASPVETWCPLCRAYFCKIHDELYPRRMHDCLRGRAEDVA